MHSASVHRLGWGRRGRIRLACGQSADLDQLQSKWLDAGQDGARRGEPSSPSAGDSTVPVTAITVHFTR